MIGYVFNSNIPEKQAKKFHNDDLSLPRFGKYFDSVKFASFSQTKHYLDLGSDASSVWNVCAPSSDVISRETAVMVLRNDGCFLKLIQKFTVFNPTL